MALSYDFFYYNTTFMLRAGLNVIIKLFFVIGFYRLRKIGLFKNYSYQLFVISIISLLYSIATFFIPAVRVEGQWTWPDLRYGFSYDFTAFRNIPASLDIILGTSMIIIGMKNKFKDRSLLLLSGILLMLMSGVYIVNYGSYYYTAWFYSQNLAAYTPIYRILNNATTIIQIMYLLALSAFSVRSKHRYIMAYCALSILTVFIF
jgi:hypothetical protein